MSKDESEDRTEVTLNTIKGLNKRKMKKTKIGYNGNCPCIEKGKDGTAAHIGRGSYTVVNTHFPNENFYCCENHVQNYREGHHKILMKNKTRQERQSEQFINQLLTELFTPEEEHNHQDLLEINRLNNVLRRIVSYGRNTALHTFFVPSESRYRVNYTVKQMLNGKFTCDCPSKQFGIGLINDTCKHIRDVMRNPSYQNDISYGQGAIEAHRRLTDIARKGLANG